MKKEFGYWIFTAVILLLCLIPSAGMLPAGDREAGGNEVLAAPPALLDGEGKVNTAYLSELTGYVEDHYFLRQRLVTAWSALNQRALHTSIADNVLLGRDGWLYFGETLDDYTGAAPMGGAEIAAAAHNLALVSEYCRSQGAEFLFTIAPNKNSLYPQHMPALPVFSERRNAQTLARALAEEGVAYLDLFTVFRGQEETLYFTQDSHWNSKGAALAADAVNAALGRSSGYFAGPFRLHADHLSDLYAMLYPTGTWREANPRYEGELDFTYDAPIRSENDLNIRTSGGGEGSLLLFRDSFGNLLYPYLADSFASALFSRAPAYRMDQIAQREADCVVVELVERNLRYLLQNIPVMPAPERETPEKVILGEDTVSFTAEPAQALPGYALVKGALPAAEGSLFLDTAPGCYEAFRLEEGGFGLYVPEEALTEGELVLIGCVEGRWMALPAYPISQSEEVIP